MNRAWITGITVATVAGTGTAAYAGMHTSATEGMVQAAAEQIASTSTVAAPSSQLLTFQAGPAGTVDVNNDGAVISIASVTPAAGWTFGSYTQPGTHVEVVLTDGTQNVTFLADLVDGEVKATVSATALTTIPPTTETPSTEATTPPTPAPTPAPQPAVPPSVVQVTIAQPPVTSHTSSPSGTGAGEDDEHESDDNEVEHEEGGDD